jgi:ActR/RegA family two-component response regulator
MIGEGETILIVDDEESVRQTFVEWLESADLSCQILTASDAEGALILANRCSIDLAILDWNLRAGHDGLRLLEDLYIFNPEVLAILVTGFAHQATPLDAMRMGVRDYLDKNQDLSRDTFLASVRKQLDRIRPGKRERLLHRSLANFRQAVEKILPLVQSASALTDPVPLPEAIGGLLHFLVRVTGAREGVLLVRSYDEKRRPAETYRAYGLGGETLEGTLVPFARSAAGSVTSLGEAACMNALAEAPSRHGVELQPFEKGHATLLAMPMAVGPGVQAVIELFDKPAFTQTDQQLAVAAAELGTDLLRQALTKRQTHQLLLDAVASALDASDRVSESMGSKDSRQVHEAAPEILASLRRGLDTTSNRSMDGEAAIRLAEAVRVLALRHGPAAVEHCTQLVEKLGQLLDRVTDAGESSREREG